MEDMNRIGIQWKPVVFNGKHYPNYEISEYGTIRNVNTNLTLVPVPLQHNGYLRVLLYDQGTRKDAKIHRIVYETFCGPIPPDMTIDHIDENKLNNHYSNLRVMTASENVKTYRRNHPDHCKIYSDETVIEYLKMLKRGVYYKYAASKCGIKSYDYAILLLRGMRRVDLVNMYAPFPDEAKKKRILNMSDERAAISMIMSGMSSKEILDNLDIKYNDRTIDKIYKLRKMVGVKDPKYYDLNFIHDIDTLILTGKTNDEIYKILQIDFNKSISWLMSRRRKLLNIPNNNFVKGNKEETDLIRKYIYEGLNNDEILSKIGKKRNQYYINLFGKERRKFKQKKLLLTSSTIEPV